MPTNKININQKQLITIWKQFRFKLLIRLQKDLNQSKKVNKIEKAVLVGKSIAEKAIAAGISQVRFDRNGYLYHGRIKSLAEGAREAGLKF